MDHVLSPLVQRGSLALLEIHCPVADSVDDDLAVRLKDV